MTCSSVNSAIVSQHDPVNAFGRCADCGGPTFGVGKWVGFDELVTTYKESSKAVEVTQSVGDVVVATATVDPSAVDKDAAGAIVPPVHSKEYVMLPDDNGIPVQHERKRLVYDWRHIGGNN